MLARKSRNRAPCKTGPREEARLDATGPCSTLPPRLGEGVTAEVGSAYTDFRFTSSGLLRRSREILSWRLVCSQVCRGPARRHKGAPTATAFGWVRASRGNGEPALSRDGRAGRSGGDGHDTLAARGPPGEEPRVAPTRRGVQQDDFMHTARVLCSVADARVEPGDQTSPRTEFIRLPGYGVRRTNLNRSRVNRGRIRAPRMYPTCRSLG